MVKRRLIARQLLGGIIFSLALAGPVLANPPTTAIIGTPPQPGWSLLSTEQKIILAPLAGEWDQMENIRRRKWLGIAERFPKMTAEEQTRVQQRMQEWAALTPEKRARIRDSYKEFSQLPAEKKLAVKERWKTYSNLPEEEKQRIRQGGKLPPPTGQPATATPSPTTSAANAAGAPNPPPPSHTETTKP